MFLTCVTTLDTHQAVLLDLRVPHLPDVIGALKRVDKMLLYHNILFHKTFQFRDCPHHKTGNLLILN